MTKNNYKYVLDQDMLHLFFESDTDFASRRSRILNQIKYSQNKGGLFTKMFKYKFVVPIVILLLVSPLFLAAFNNPNNQTQLPLIGSESGSSNVSISDNNSSNKIQSQVPSIGPYNRGYSQPRGDYTLIKFSTFVFLVAGFAISAYLTYLFTVYFIVRIKQAGFNEDVQQIKNIFAVFLLLLLTYGTGAMLLAVLNAI